MNVCLLPKIWVKILEKNISKSVSGKNSKKLLDLAKLSATDALKTTSKRVIKKKTVEATGDLICNKIPDEITKTSKTLPKKNKLEKVSNK